MNRFGDKDLSFGQLSKRQEFVRKVAEKELDRVLKNFKTQGKSDVASREFAVETVGLSGISLELAKIGQSVSAGEEGVANAYAREMVLAVKQLEAIPGLPAREFTAAAKSVVEDVMRVANTDPLITSIAKKEVTKIGNELLSYIDRRGNVYNRVRSGTNTLLKRGRSSLADSLQSKGGIVLGSLGKFLRRSEEVEAQQKQVAEIAATSRRGINDASQMHDAEAKSSALQRMITPRDEETGKFTKRGPWFDQYRVLKDIHGELKGQRQTKAQRDAKYREANERMLEASDNQSPLRMGAAGGNKPNSGMNAPNLGTSFWSKLLGGFLTGGAGGGVLGFVGKSLGALGNTALIGAAALAGWKIGEMIDKWTGASNLVQKGAEWLYSKATGKETASEAGRSANQEGQRIRNQRSAEVQRLGGKSGTDAENIKWLQSDSANAARQGRQAPKVAPAVTVSDYTPTVLRHEDLDQYTSMNQYPNAVSPQRVSSAAADSDAVSPKDLHFSSTGFTNLVNSEGLRTKAYKDTRGVWTIGVGETEWDGKPVSPTNPGREITREEAISKMSTRVLSDFEPMVRNQLKKPVSQSQFDALVHLAYNSPKGAKKIINKINAGEAVTQDDFMSATKIKENERGLVVRREKEFAMFNGETPHALTPLASPTVLSSTRAAAPILQASAELATNQMTAPIIIASQSAPQRPIIVSSNPTPIPVPIKPHMDDLKLMLAQRANAL